MASLVQGMWEVLQTQGSVGTSRYCACPLSATELPASPVDDSHILQLVVGDTVALSHIYAKVCFAAVKLRSVLKSGAEHIQLSSFPRVHPPY